MTDPNTEIVRETAVDAFAGIPGVAVMFAVGKEDGFHPLRVHRRDTWRVVIDGWHPSFHRSAMHVLVSPSMDAGVDAFRQNVRVQIETLVRSQSARARNARKLHGLEAPYHRHPFETDGGYIEVDHLLINYISLLRMAAEEEGDPCAIRTRIARLANREIHRKEGLDKGGPELTLRKTELTCAIPLGDRGSMLDGRVVFLRDRLPETVLAAAGGWKQGPLSRLVEAKGIDHLEIESVVDGQVFSQDPRPYARECSVAFSLKGDVTGRIGTMLSDITAAK